MVDTNIPFIATHEEWMSLTDVWTFTCGVLSDLSTNVFCGRKCRFHYDLVNLHYFPFRASQCCGQSRLIGGSSTSQEVVILGLKK